MKGTYNKQDETFTIQIEYNIEGDKSNTTRAFKAFEVITFLKEEYKKEIEEIETLGLTDCFYIKNGKINWEGYLNNLGPETLVKIYNKI